jgi:hypothetical protein
MDVVVTLYELANQEVRNPRARHEVRAQVPPDRMDQYLRILTSLKQEHSDAQQVNHFVARMDGARPEDRAGIFDLIPPELQRDVRDRVDDVDRQRMPPPPPRILPPPPTQAELRGEARAAAAFQRQARNYNQVFPAHPLQRPSSMDPQELAMQFHYITNKPQKEFFLQMLNPTQKQLLAQGLSAFTGKPMTVERLSRYTGKGGKRRTRSKRSRRRRSKKN